MFMIDQAKMLIDTNRFFGMSELPHHHLLSSNSCPMLLQCLPMMMVMTMMMMWVVEQCIIEKMKTRYFEVKVLGM